MNREEAKEILMLYRPGSADDRDPEFAAALGLCDSDPELKRWFDDHCAVYRALRTRFRVAVPEGLKEQILAERVAHTTPLWRRRPAALAAVATLALIAGVVTWLLQPREATDSTAARNENRFDTFRNRGAVSTALLSYRMDLSTNDLEQIRTYCRRHEAVADYVLPAGLQQNAEATGCMISTWQGRPVTMLCFRSSARLPHGANDLWLFVVDQSAFPDPPAGPAPAFTRVERSTTASWSSHGRTYVLVGTGDEQFLRKFL
jgi:hypothetical protein